MEALGEVEEEVLKEEVRVRVPDRLCVSDPVREGEVLLQPDELKDGEGEVEGLVL